MRRWRRIADSSREEEGATNGQKVKRPIGAPTAMASESSSPVERRLKQLERLLLTTGDGETSSAINVSVDTLLDALIVLFDECFNSALRREKTVSDFLDLSELFRKKNARHTSLANYH